MITANDYFTFKKLPRDIKKEIKKAFKELNNNFKRVEQVNIDAIAMDGVKDYAILHLANAEKGIDMAIEGLDKLLELYESRMLTEYRIKYDILRRKTKNIKEIIMNY